MIKEKIQKISQGQDLSLDEAKDLINFFAENKATQGQIGAFLTALKLKGETSDEITGFAYQMRQRAFVVDTKGLGEIVDSCGTGGDGTNTFNISTTAAIVASSSGLNVAKHSNFGITSKCGSSNVIEALKLNMAQNPKEARENLEQNNITFLHSPYFHKATASVNPIRKEIGIRTVFNFLGPLVNPTFPTGQIIGVAVADMCSKMTETLKNLGCKKAFVVNGQNPTIDEISICGKTLVYKLENEKIEKYYIHPSDFGIKQAKLEELIGSTPEHNAQITEKILKGEIEGAPLDAVAINTAALLYVGNKASSLENGLKQSFELINSGKAYKKLQSLQG